MEVLESCDYVSPICINLAGKENEGRQNVQTHNLLTLSPAICMDFKRGDFSEIEYSHSHQLHRRTVQFLHKFKIIGKNVTYIAPMLLQTIKSGH